MIPLQERHCTLCGPEAKKKIKYKSRFNESDLNADIFSARRSPDRKHFQLVECAVCGIVYSDPACDPSVLSQLYRRSTVNYASQEAQIYRSYVPVLDRALRALKIKRDVFLEIGGGSGFMLKYAVKRGFAHQIEVEPSADAEARFYPESPNSKFVRATFEADTVPDNSVSLACFFQMLDHVPSPLEFLRNVYQCLEPGGVAVCVTHNTQALSAHLLGERSPIFDIEHTYLFNPTNMARLFARAGFQGMQSFDVANHYAVRHWLNLAPLPKGLKEGLLAPLETVRLADMPIKLNAGNFGMIGRKPK